MDEEQKRHLSIVNASGFPFQLASFEQIDSWNTRWLPALPEHPWRHPETGREGYIDYILNNRINSTQRLVVECKRQRGDARWYFLGLRGDTYKVRFILSRREYSTPLAGDGEFHPKSEEAEFCVLPGENSSRRPTLERVADELLQSVEALAAEELVVDRDLASFRYLPIVLTNARLYICHADLSAVSLVTGELDPDTDFEQVPFIRFRKTLWSQSVESKAASVEDIRRERERTIVVVSAYSLKEFLQNATF